MPDNIGNPHDRIDGRLKVTGDARYAADFAVPNPLHAHLVISTIGRGRITGIDDKAARAVPGVRAIYTHKDQPDIQPAGFFGAGQGQAQQSWRPLAGPDVKFYGEIVGMVVAETILAAREAAAALRFTYEAEEPAATLDAPGTTVEEIEKKSIDVGDVDTGMANAARSVAQSYATAPNHHNAMELFATTAHWQGEELTVYVPSQWVKGFQAGLAKNLGIDAQRIRVRSPFIGGAFGGKGTLFTFTGLVAAAARDLRRPVKLYVTREQGFTVASFRAETQQDVKLGAGADGLITTVVHTGRELSSRPDTYFVYGAENTTRMYRADNIKTGLHVVHADRQTPGFMRAPPETPYFFALESAVDELARELKIDPVELRIRNDVDHDPVRGVPFTSRSLVECFRRAGDAFGWSDYTPEIGSMTDGDELIGWGVATATYPTQMAPCAVRVSLDASGDARVQVASHDIGTGAYTVLAQAVHGKLGVPVERVRVELGDSRLPPGTIAGGSISTASNVSAINIACDRIRERLKTPGGDLDATSALERFGQSVDRGIRRVRPRPPRRAEERHPSERHGADRRRRRGEVCRLRLRRRVRRGAHQPLDARDPRAAHRRRFRRWPDHEREDGALAVSRRDGLGHRPRAARDIGGRPAHRRLHERQHLGISRSGERRHSPDRGDPGARGRRQGEPRRRQGHWRDRHRRHRRGGRQRRPPRHRHPRAEDADPHRGSAGGELTIGGRPRLSKGGGRSRRRAGGRASEKAHARRVRVGMRQDAIASLVGRPQEATLRRSCPARRRVPAPSGRA